MFDSLEEKMKHDQDAVMSTKERIAEGVVIAGLSILLFSALFFVVWMFE